MKVLVIDDTRAARVTACLGLTWAGGIAVCQADTGPEGVLVAKRERPDVILLDAGLSPSLAVLHSDPVTAEIPVLLTSAEPLSLDAAHLAAMGARSLLCKPLRPESLAAEISRLL